MRIPPSHWLPSGQPLIETENIRRFNLYMDIALDSCELDQQPVIAAITGDSGAGKTVAAYAFLSKYTPQLHTGLPVCLGMEIKSKSSGLAVAQGIVDICGYPPRGRNMYEMADEAIKALKSNQIRILMVDEGDRLNTESFDVLRYIYDHSRVALVVVGLPAVLKVIDGSGKKQFSNRTSLRMTFKPLTYEEFLSTILPSITTAHWEFERSREEDLEISSLIWKWTGSSFRETCRLIQTASAFAKRDHSSRVGLKHLKNAYLAQEHTEAKQNRLKQQKERAGAVSHQDGEQMGELEQESARRRDANEKGKSRS